MKSVCMKFNNSKEILDIAKKYQESYIDKTKVSVRKFRIFYNFIIHYYGTDNKEFFIELASILSEYIIYNYERKFIKNYIKSQYYYFNKIEKEKLYDLSLKILELQELEVKYKREILISLIYDYIKNNKRIYVEGMKNFRIKEYIEILEYVVELAAQNM